MGLTTQGYLQQLYLETPYLASTAQQGYSSQVERVIAASPALHMQVSDDIVAFPDGIHSQAKLQIASALAAVSSQVEQVIAAASAVHMQVSDDIANVPDGIHSQVEQVVAAAAALSSQTARLIAAAAALSSQAARDIASIPGLSSQVQRGISAAPALSMQVADEIAATSLALHSQAAIDIVGQPRLGSQAARSVASSPGPVGMQLLYNTFLHTLGAEYLIKPYLATPYLGLDMDARGRFQVSLNPTSFAHLGMQVDDDIANVPAAIHSQVARTILLSSPLHMQVADDIVGLPYPTSAQVQRIIARQLALSSQAQRLVLRSYGVSSQVQRVFVGTYHMQTTLVLYNTTNLRILDKFPSRGNGTNWTADSTAPGDFSVNNLNNDIVEFRWQSNGATNAVLTADTGVPQGVFVDTIGILGHNFTLSAVIVLQESNDPTFSTVGHEVTLPTTLLNMYYIAPTLPMAGYRYQRFVINDPTNPAGMLQVGTIVYGAAIIFIGEDIVDQIKFTKKHFKDTILTEGYTNASNDRALRRLLGLQFKDMDFLKANYTSLSALFDYARTNLKCLWIPSPQYPTRYAVFGKMVQLPEETHNDKGEEINYIDLNIDIDESL